ncbi:hypothetical protein PanWU01x14_209740 [Parasponia andersonii]|uniref:Uncharacterized protein n=1 Tax=Parasponia andersonii TaxID=3476 RepID=A0A2P5BUB3_PARAD|nr:hypothetical protein PanWU01x14_209740 [Parasponia andersonii]
MVELIKEARLVGSLAMTEIAFDGFSVVDLGPPMDDKAFLCPLATVATKFLISCVLEIMSLPFVELTGTKP